VEERLAFFETGAPPGKNADAIRKVLDQLALEKEDGDEDMQDAEPVLPLIEAEPPRKKDKKKKRKLDEMDVDEEDAEPEKKVKLSKEEKKALKKEKKRERMKEEDADVVSDHVLQTFQGPDIRAYQDLSRKTEKKEKMKEEKEKVKKEKKSKH
jgi:nucleolar protein 56